MEGFLKYLRTGQEQKSRDRRVKGGRSDKEDDTQVCSGQEVHQENGLGRCHDRYINICFFVYQCPGEKIHFTLDHLH